MGNIFSNSGVVGSRMVLLCLFGGASHAVQAAIEPTDYEQYILELTNRARDNPNNEVALLSSYTWGDTGSPALADLNEGVPAGTITGAPKQPLAFDLDMMQATSDYNAALLAADTITHTLAGTTPGTRLNAAGYAYTNTPGVEEAWENIALTISPVPLSINSVRAQTHHDLMIVDGDNGGRSHRRNIFNPSFTSIGISLGTDNDFTLVPSATNAFLTVQKFAFRDENFFITGVAYNDLDNNLFYTPGGEGLGGHTLEVYQAGTTNLVDSTTTFGSGGYTLQLPEGGYDFRFVGPGVEQWERDLYWTNGQNLKMDFIDPIPEPGSLFLTLLGVGYFLGRRSPRSRSSTA